MSTWFFVLVILSIYSYVIYPVLLKALRSISSVGIDQGDLVLKASIIISAYNESAVIGEKIENSLALEYPSESLEIIVVSDGSTDETDEIVEAYTDRNVILISSKVRQGKTAGLNTAMKRASGEIVIFTDADAMFPPDSLQKMSQYFNDQSVGLVTGSTLYLLQTEEEMARSAGLYTKLEKLIKRLETQTGSCVGADGAIFAIRKELYKPLRDDDINDLVIPLNVIRSKKRVVLHDELVCLEPPSTDEKSAYLRQARITNRTLRALFRSLDLLNFVQYKNFSFKLFSHKHLRLCAPLFMLILIPLNLYLLNSSAWFVFFMLGQVFFYGFAVLGGKFEIFKPFNHFVLVQISILYGWYLYLKGENMVTWKPRN